MAEMLPKIIIACTDSDKATLPPRSFSFFLVGVRTMEVLVAATVPMAIAPIAMVLIAMALMVPVIATTPPITKPLTAIKVMAPIKIISDPMLMAMKPKKQKAAVAAIAAECFGPLSTNQSPKRVNITANTAITTKPIMISVFTKFFIYYLLCNLL